MSDATTGQLQTAIDFLVRERARLLEEAAEDALQHGHYGVLALSGPDGTFMAKEHPQVPYGHLYEASTSATTQEALVAAFISWHPA